MDARRSAILVRMVTPEHTCPFGVRAKELLEQNGFHVEGRVLRTRQDVDRFESEQGVSTTPQVFIDDERIGGCEELEAYLA
jgi:glutaredoxin